MNTSLKRCGWVNMKNDLYVHYHDKEWGVPVHDENKLFEMLLLESSQAGLSWEIILNKRKSYKDVFDNFDPNKIAQYDSKKQNTLLQDSRIIRNKMKINSAVQNAKIFLKIQKEFGSFDNYIWKFVNRIPIQNKFKSTSDLPAKTSFSNRISMDLKKRGMKFVGPTIMYAYMQSIGMVNDHEISCFRYEQLKLSNKA